jgi:hypothetical protein
MTTDTMTRDGEIPAIFNPTKRVRTPSVVVTGENGPFSGFTAIPQITHSDSVTSSQPDVESLTCISASGHGHGPETPLTGLNPLPPTSLEPVVPQTRTKYRKCKDSCCSELAHKVGNLLELGGWWWPANENYGSPETLRKQFITKSIHRRSIHRTNSSPYTIYFKIKNISRAIRRRGSLLHSIHRKTSDPRTVHRGSWLQKNHR